MTTERLGIGGFHGPIQMHWNGGTREKTTDELHTVWRRYNIIINNSNNTWHRRPKRTLTILLGRSEPAILFVYLYKGFEGLLSSGQTILSFSYLMSTKLYSGFPFNKGRCNLHDDSLDSVCRAPPLLSQQFHADSSSHQYVPTSYHGGNDPHKGRLEGKHFFEMEIE